MADRAGPLKMRRAQRHQFGKFQRRQVDRSAIEFNRALLAQLQKRLKPNGVARARRYV
ncbi:MAG: hypothetical protein WC856_05555 [Methylococcaceae bacterium]